MNKRKKIAKRGEFWSINDKRSRGHTSFIVRGNRRRKRILHLPITHSPYTRNIKNIKLNENPEFSFYDDSYILPKVQFSNEKALGRRRNNFQIKNTIDKSIVRNIIKRNKKR